MAERTADMQLVRRNRLAARVAAAGAGSLLAIALSPAPSHAQTWADDDPSRDVRAMTYSPDPKPCGTVTELDGSDNTAYDITRLSVQHLTNSVHLTVGFRDLKAKVEHFTEVHLRTNDKNYFVAIDHFASGKPELALFREPKPIMPDECGSSVILSSDLACARLSGGWSAKNDIVYANVPRACLKDPRWVRAGAGSYGWVDGTIFNDRWAPEGTEPVGLAGPFGPQVRR